MSKPLVNFINSLGTVDDMSEEEHFWAIALATKKLLDSGGDSTKELYTDLLYFLNKVIDNLPE